MRKISVLVSGALAACGGDDGNQMVDAKPNTGPAYDLSCLDYAPTTAPDPITLALTLVDLGAAPNTVTVPMTAIDVYSVDGAQMLTTATTDDMGVAMLSLPTNGAPRRFEYKIEPTTMPKQRIFVSNPAWDNGAGPMPLLPQTLVDSLYTAAGATPDAANGTVIAFFADCSGNNMPSLTPSIAEDPGQVWSMYGGVGAWLTRASTVNHPQNIGQSVAGTVNVAPGPKTLHIKTVTSELTPVTFLVEAGALTVLYYYPGDPRPH